MLMTLDEAILHAEEVAEKQEIKAKSNLIEIDKIKADGILRLYDADEYESCMKCAKEHRQLAGWLKELKAYREDTRFADLYERICIKRDDDREYFAQTKDKTYITRIAEKEMFIHMMQDMMFDRYGVEEVNADGDSN